MTKKVDQLGRFAMLRGTLLQLPTMRPLKIGSAGETVWIALDYDVRDLMLDHGERTIVEAPARVLAYALDDAVLEVRAAAGSTTQG
jgi:hypothetical protein